MRDNSATHDVEPFTPFGRVVAGMEVADAFTTEYGEGPGGIRAGKQDACAGGNSLHPRELRTSTTSKLRRSFRRAPNRHWQWLEPDEPVEPVEPKTRTV
jgi:hypothetical protein